MLKIGQVYPLAGGGEATVESYAGPDHFYVWAKLNQPGHPRHGHPTAFDTTTGKNCGSPQWKIGDIIMPKPVEEEVELGGVEEEVEL